MTYADFKPGMRVAYVPRHGDVEHGKVSSVGEIYVFVRFDRQVEKWGWELTTAQACDSRDLVPFTPEPEGIAENPATIGGTS